MAAPTKKSEPMIPLSLALTAKAEKSNPPITPGHNQHTTPATAKTMAKALIIIVAHLAPTVGRARGNQVRRNVAPEHRTECRAYSAGRAVGNPRHEMNGTLKSGLTRYARCNMRETHHRLPRAYLETSGIRSMTEVPVKTAIR
jgi:hypothetical protein